MKVQEYDKMHYGFQCFYNNNSIINWDFFIDEKTEFHFSIEEETHNRLNGMN